MVKTNTNIILSKAQDFVNINLIFKQFLYIIVLIIIKGRKNMLKKLTSIVLSMLFAIFLLTNLFACKTNGGSFTFSCFNTQVHVQCNHKKVDLATQNEIKGLFTDLYSNFNANDKNSFLTQINDASANQVFTLDGHKLSVFSSAKEVYNFSNGYFDPTVYPLVKLWGFAPYVYTPNYIQPQQEQIDDALSSISFDKIILDIQQKILYKTDQTVKLDLGGLVKGYASQLAGQILTSAGYNSGYVNVGGSSLFLLQVPSLDIRHPRKTGGQAILTVNCQGQSNLNVSTSGDYEKYYIDANQNKYCHIINPKTGYPTTTGVASVTIMGIDGAISDGLSTSACLMEYSSSNDCSLKEYLRKVIFSFPNCSIFAVVDNGQNKVVLTNKTQGEHFTLHDDEYQVVSI